MDQEMRPAKPIFWYQDLSEPLCFPGILLLLVWLLWKAFKNRKQKANAVPRHRLSKQATPWRVPWLASASRRAGHIWRCGDRLRGRRHRLVSFFQSNFCWQKYTKRGSWLGFLASRKHRSPGSRKDSKKSCQEAQFGKENKQQKQL